MVALAFAILAIAVTVPILNLVISFELFFSPVAKLAVATGVPLSAAAFCAWMLRKSRHRMMNSTVQWLTKIGMAASFSMAVYGALRIHGIFDSHALQRAEWREVVDSEEAILSLAPAMKQLSFAVRNLSLPDFQSRQLFSEQLEWNDLIGKQPEIDHNRREKPAAMAWEVSKNSETTSRDHLQLWQTFLKSVSYFKHAKFYVVRGSFTSPGKDTFETEVGFNGSARLVKGDWTNIHGSIAVTWERGTDKEDEKAWMISRWNLEKLEAIESEQLFFEDVLDEALPSQGDLTSARTSLHEQLVIESLDSEKAPYRHFARDAFDHHPGVSVVDLNTNGYDDFYVMVRSGPNLFYENNGDGTFHEKAEELGLAIENHTSSAIFADFDNDGDKDAFLGRNLLSSLYLENVNGRFSDRSGSATGGLLPSLVSSVSAVDYDNDGLLDIYFSTYAADLLSSDAEAIGIYLSHPDYSRLQSLLRGSEAHEILNAPGPPNRLLRNLGGGKFGDPGSAATDLELFRNSYQSTWSDFDGDGDQDLYVANDFAGNSLLKNENGRFVDVAEETGTTDIGFGMGASWGDYDNDGDQDLYVSNMYSKAGRRITEQFDSLDPRIALMARGNSLFRNEGGSFQKVSGIDEPSLKVEKAGWSWGGQFVDINNDGYLDIHALSGYYTSPREFGLPDL